MADGWIKLHRSITDCWVYQEKPFSKGQAWIDLLLLANHKPKSTPFDGEIIVVDRGSFVTSELKLMERWGWSKTKLRCFLKLLQSDQMIFKKSDNKKTIIEIVNYDTYQDLQTTKKPIKDQSETAERPLKDFKEYTTKNIRKKESKNEKKYINNSTSKVFTDDSLEMILAEKLLLLIRMNNPNYKQPNMQSWAKDFDAILRIDKRPPDEVEKVITWVQRDNFWKTNILSPGKLREKYDQLILKMNSQSGKPRKLTSDEATDIWLNMTEGYIP